MPSNERRGVVADVVHDDDDSCDASMPNESFVFRSVAEEGEDHVGYLHAKATEYEAPCSAS